MTSKRESLTPEERQTLARLLGKVGRGFRDWNHAQLSASARLTVAKRWAIRRLRYGPTGQRPRSYADWRKSHKLPPIGPEGENAPKH